MSEGKIGAGHAAGMGRLGFKELRNAAVMSRDGIADNEIGIFGTQTQGEIAQGRGGPGAGPEQEGKVGKEAENQLDGKSMSMDDLRGYAKEKSQEAEKRMDGNQRQKQMER